MAGLLVLVEEDAEAVSALTRQYYSIRGGWPKRVLLPFATEDMADLEQLFSEASGRRVYVEAPQRGEKRFLVERAMLNAKEEYLRFTTVAQRRQKTLEWLQEILELPALPERIEAFDISNTGNFGIVAAMTVFVNGKPLKRDYRKFRIKEGTGQDDYGSMREAVKRRYQRYLDKDAAFDALPDLLLIDGGAVHAHAAESVLSEMGLRVPVMGMVKDDRHRTRALIDSGGKEVGLTGNPAGFAFIGGIQEETHRFAIEYHRSLRSATIGSKLEEIPGVGEKRRNELLRHFKTIKAIAGASIEELNAVVPKNTARAVYDYFHSGEAESESAETPAETEETR